MSRQKRGNWPFYTVWIIILVSTVAATRMYNVESERFYGTGVSVFEKTA